MPHHHRPRRLRHRRGPRRPGSRPPATSPPTSGARPPPGPPTWPRSSASASVRCWAGTTSTSTRSDPGRWLWLFQDAFIDHPGLATSLDGVGFAHNAALLQTGTCFTLLHRGTAAQPSSFEPGAGEVVLSRWWWPLGGELDGGVLRVFWAEMVHDGAEPPAGDGLPWHPVQTWLATYDANDLTRLGFVPAPGPTPSGPKPPPLYGYAVASDDSFSYLFGNTYQQNLTLEGGFWDGPHSATDMWLARVPRGRLDERPKYWTGTGWAQDPSKAEPIDSRYWTENPMQPRFIDGRWVAVTKENGFWGEKVAVDVAPRSVGAVDDGAAGGGRRRSHPEHVRRARRPMADARRQPHRLAVTQRPGHAP